MSTYDSSGTKLEVVPDDIPEDAVLVDLTNCRLRSIENLTKLVGIERICLRNNFIKKAEGLDQCINLEELDLYGNEIPKIENVSGLVRLTKLDFSFNHIRAIEGLETLVNVTELYLASNKLSKIENLGSLVNLTMLELGLDTLVNLRSLWLGKNKITKIEGLGTLRNLRSLSLQNNRITVIEGLEGLPLEELFLSFNGLTQIAGLDTLGDSLTILDLANNQISALDNLAHLRQLTDLWMNDNRVASFQELSKLSKSLSLLSTRPTQQNVEHLETVYLERNPLQQDTQYQNKILDFIPNLKQLDANEILRGANRPRT